VKVGAVTNGSTTRLINVGHGNVVVANHVVAIVALDSLPVKRLIESAKGSSKLVDATNGRRTRAVVVTTSDHLILSSLEPATLAQRLDSERDLASEMKPRVRPGAAPRREAGAAAAPS
jgi:extracellular matrix regulatory protein A